MACQLEFFSPEKTEIEYLKDEIRSIKESTEKVRRSIFARHSELAKKYIELHERMQILERNICTGAATTLFRS